MMYYTTSDNVHFAKDGVKVAPKPWFNSKYDNHLKILHDHFEKHLRCHDTDGHSDELIFVFDDGAAYKLYYEAYWIDDDDDGRHLDQYWYYERLSLDQVPSWMHKRRDWI